MFSERFWIAFGLAGQLLFTARFLVQWLSSEREGRSVIPMSFWYLSVSGGAVLFTYALYRGDPVFIIGQSTGLFIYLRNIHLVQRTLRAEAIQEELRSATVKLSINNETSVSPTQPQRRAA